jgi:hypothetical protein
MDELAEIARVEHSIKYPPPKRTITEGMYDRVRANRRASTLVLTRLEWELLCAANGYHPDDEPILFGRPVVILEDEEMSW